MLRIGLLGCGRIGRLHAGNIAAHPRAELSAVYDIAAAASREVAERTGARVCGSDEEILCAVDIDAVFIASATSTHADYVERAVAARKPAFCEKPIDLDLARVNRCVRACRAGGIPVQIGFNRRFDPGHRAARDAVRGGEIGELQQVVITSRDPEMAPRAYLETSGGILRDMTIHDFDLARFLLADDPVEVFAVADRLIEPAMMAEIGDHDSAMVVLRTADGKQCVINNSRTAVYGYDQRAELFGSEGMLISGNRRPHELRRFGAARTETAVAYEYFFTERYAEAFRAELAAFVDCVESGSPADPDFEDGRLALVLAEAAYRSVDERRIVRVDEVA